MAETALGQRRLPRQVSKDSMSSRAALVVRTYRRFGAGALFAFSALFALSGNPLLALVPTILVAMCWAAFALPFDSVLPAAVFTFVVTNAPASQPGSKVFNFPLNPLGKLLYTNLPTKFALADIIIGLLAFRAVAIVLLSEFGVGIDRRPPRPFAQTCLIGLLTILGLEIWGVFLNDGDFKNSLWQLRIPLLLPCLAFAVSVAATDKGIRRIRFALLAAGLVKSFEAIFAYWVAGLKNIKDVIYVTQHSDSVLWAVCVAILVSEWFESRRSVDRLRLFLFSVPLTLAMIANNRRTVWVIIAASLALIALTSQRATKRSLARLLSAFWPVLLIYVVVGLSSASPVFKPVQMIRSVVVQDDDSSDTRDIENTNLLITLREKPIVGYGFGHKYNEFIVAYDISKDFEQYRYLPHNSFLGFWAMQGLIGASLYFLLLVVGLFYLAAARRETDRGFRRSSATWAACAVIAWLVQAWSDLAMQDWTAMVCCAVGIGIGGGLARLVAAESDASPRRLARPVLGLEAPMPALTSENADHALVRAR